MTREAAPPDAPVVAFCLTGDVRRNSRALRQTAALAGAGWTVEAVSLGEAVAGGDGALAPGVRHRVLPRPTMRGPRFFLAVHRQMQAALHALPRADVLHASDLYTLPASLLDARRRRRAGHPARVVFDSRESYPDTPAVANRPWVRRAWRLVERWAVPRADAVLTVSDALADVLAARLPLGRTLTGARPLVLENAAPPVDPAPDAPRDLRARAGLPPTARVVLHTGALRAGRGLDTLVDAVGALAARVPDVALVLLGDGDLADTLADRGRRIGAEVRVVPPVPPSEVPAWAASADVAAVTLDGRSLNLRVSLPNKLFEAVAGGIPVVASDLPALRAFVTAHGNGLLVPPADPDALADALARVLTDAALHARLSDGARAAQRAVSPEAVAARLVSLYDRLRPSTAAS